MLARVSRLRHPLAIPLAVALTIFAFACGSSSVTQVRGIGGGARWALLFVLFALALVAALRSLRVAVSRSVLAAGAALVALMFASAVWSVDSRLSFERAVTFAVMLATAALLAHASASDRTLPERIFVGVVAGAAAVALAGLLVLAFDRDAAVHFGGHDLPSRYEGLGENPNTVALLLAVCLPVIAWLLFAVRGTMARALVAAAALLFDGSIIASGSRGALIGGFCGVLLVVALAPFPRRRRLAAVAAVAALFGVSFAIALAPKSGGYAPQPAAASAPARRARTTSKPPRPPRYLNVQGAYPLEFDIGSQGPNRIQPTSRPLFGLSGRSQAWSGAITLGDKRPVAGYGFGTERNVFVDRYALFASDLPENSYIGLYLQLGAAGLLCFAALVVALIVGILRAPSRWSAAAPLGVLLAALLLAMVQSYIYSVGNVATLTVWICAFLGAAALGRTREIV